MRTQTPISPNYYYRPAQPANTPKPHRFKKLRGLILLAIIIGLVYHFIGVPGLPNGSNHTSSQKVSAASGARASLSSAQASTMAAQINSVIVAHPELDIGIAVQDLNTGKTYTCGENEPFIAASVSKVLTATLFLHEVEQGNASLTDSVGGSTAQYQLQQLIEQSDNTAWEDFNSLLGHQELKDYANQIGLSNYDPDDNSLTVDTIATLLGKLYKQQLLNKSDTNLLLSYMQNANETEYISASIPAGVKVYHKAGWLEDRVHDAAIIDNGKHPYVLVIFTKAESGTYDTTVGQQVFASITGATTKAFL